MLTPFKRIILAALGLFSATAALAQTNSDNWTSFSNQGSIANTRHNMTQQSLDGVQPDGSLMNLSRNNYAQVCVYCHTPHGANTDSNVAAAPLWNRTYRATTYTLYNSQTLSGTATQPGPNSLTCLSCHDGQTAIDSIINMPGSGRYNAAQMTSFNDAFLDSWSTSGKGSASNNHARLSSPGCFTCHNADGPDVGVQDFTVFEIGKGNNLADDHPIGVPFPSGSDWNPNFIERGNLKFLDKDGNQRASKEELRFYSSGGQGFEIECASCHDPHGVPGGDGTFLPSFLRVSVDGSQICLTCHVK